MIELLADALHGLITSILDAFAGRAECQDPVQKAFCLPAFLADPRIQAFAPFGSRIVCNPIPPESDKDWLIFVKSEDARKISDELWQRYGFGGGNRYPERYLQSFHKDRGLDLPPLNLVLVTSRLHFDLTMQATAICKEMNLLDKADRIRVHEAIEYGRLGPEDCVDSEREAQLLGKVSAPQGQRH